jgi:hypothetical protein
MRGDGGEARRVELAEVVRFSSCRPSRESLVFPQHARCSTFAVPVFARAARQEVLKKRLDK